MNKFVKVSLILAGIFMAVGLIFCFVSGIVGGRQLVYSIAEDEELDDKIESLINSFLVSLNVVTDGEWFPKFDEDTVVLSEVKDTSYVIPLTDVKNLEISVGAGELTIEEKELADGNIEIEVTGLGEWEYDIEENTLHLNAFDKVVNTATIGEITVSIPKDSYFEEVDVEVGAGVIEISDMNAKDMEASIGAGEAVMERIEAAEFAAEVNAGNLEVKDMNSVNVELSVDLGECVYEGTITGNLEADCDMGNLDLELTGSEADHNYVLECDAGNIDIGDRAISGMSAEKVIDNGMTSNFEISCGLGNITVDFEE